MTHLSRAESSRRYGQALRLRAEGVRSALMRLLWLSATLLSVGCSGHERVSIGRDDPITPPQPSCEVAGLDSSDRC